MAIESLGRMLIYIGVVMVLIGGFFILVARVPWFGKLPGDIVYRRDGFSLYIPFATMILVSLMLTLLMNIVWRR
jgi:low affinity Fe/Cu permease